MKKPVLILAITALTTFVMGWVAHRVYKNSQAATAAQYYSDSSQYNRVLKPATLPVQQDTTKNKPDSSLYHQASFDASKKDSITIKANDTLVTKKTGSLEDIDDSKKKYTSSHAFDEFKVTQFYKGAFAKKLNFSTCKSGQLYKSDTKRSFEKGINFAGRYAFTRISCGTDCYSSTIVDVKTGKVYSGPHAVSGYKFKADSRMLLVNPPDKNGYYTSCEVCDPEVYLWTGTAFKKLR